MECMPVINQKGGVGKTATSVNLGAALAQRGKRVLLIDMDPQGHLTTHLGLDGRAKGAGIYEVLTKGLPLEAAIHVYSSTVSVVPAQIDLAAAETELIATVGREVILRDTLASQEWPFDIAIVDCPPSLGVLTLNALSAATQVLIPLQPHFLALQGVGKLFETIALVAQRINPRLRVAGMVMCLYEPATRLGGEVIADLCSFLDSARNSPVPWRDARLMDTRIRRNVKLAECPSYGQSIFEYEPRSHGAIDYLALADELLAILAPKTVPANTVGQAMPVHVQPAVMSGEKPVNTSPPKPPARPEPQPATAPLAEARIVAKAPSAQPPRTAGFRKNPPGVGPKPYAAAHGAPAVNMARGTNAGRATPQEAAQPAASRSQLPNGPGPKTRHRAAANPADPGKNSVPARGEPVEPQALIASAAQESQQNNPVPVGVTNTAVAPAH